MDEATIALILEEFRKNSAKLDEYKNNNDQQISALETRIFDRLEKSEKQHMELLFSQKESNKEHMRMNDLLEEHIRRTELLEGVTKQQSVTLDEIQSEIEPVLEQHRIVHYSREYRMKAMKRYSVFLGVCGGAVGLAYTILKIFGYT